MRIIQPLKKQDVMPLHRALLDTMKGSMTDEATTSTEEEVSVIRRETRKGVKGEAIYSDGNGIGEHGTLVESEPMGIVVIRYQRLNYPETSSINPFLYTLESVKDVSLPEDSQTKDRTNRVERKNMGLAHTIVEGAGCSGIDPSQIPMICSLPKIHQ
jgi:hypothetical protein